MSRNFRCKNYTRCLTHAAKRGHKNLPCETCRFRGDRTARQGTDYLPGCIALLAMVFQPTGAGLDPRLARELVEGSLADIACALASDFFSGRPVDSVGYD